MEDLLIRGGEVVVGTAASGRRTDIAVRGDRLLGVDPDYPGPGHRVIEAKGHVVAPGFIDVRTHSDFASPLYPRAESRVHQGITTELIAVAALRRHPSRRAVADQVFL
jgi:N-acyl-D-aspartate/D-glutamate deacylase